MNAVIRSGLALALVLSAVGCQKKEEAAPAPAASAPAVVQPAAPPAAPAPAAPVPVALGDLPTVEDFEQQAQDEINPQNMDQELDRLEREIGQ